VDALRAHEQRLRQAVPHHPGCQPRRPTVAIIRPRSATRHEAPYHDGEPATIRLGATTSSAVVDAHSAQEATAHLRNAVAATGRRECEAVVIRRACRPNTPRSTGRIRQSHCMTSTRWWRVCRRRADALERGTPGEVDLWNDHFVPGVPRLPFAPQLHRRVECRSPTIATGCSQPPWKAQWMTFGAGTLVPPRRRCLVSGSTTFVLVLRCHVPVNQIGNPTPS
jgi:hypothetical protein